MTRLEEIKKRWKETFEASREELEDFFGVEDIQAVEDLKWLCAEFETALVKLREAQVYTPPIVATGIAVYFKRVDKQDPQ